MVKEQTSRKYSLLPPPVVLLILGFTLVVIILYALESQAMFGFFKRTEVQLSPPVKGRITNNGKPLAGVEVVRDLFYEGYDKENSVIDYALTNINGEFSFNEKIIKSRYPGDIFGENLPVSQQIYIQKDTHEQLNEEDRYYWLWRINKNWKSFPILYR